MPIRATRYKQIRLVGNEVPDGLCEALRCPLAAVRAPGVVEQHIHRCRCRHSDVYGGAGGRAAGGDDCSGGEGFAGGAAEGVGGAHHLLAELHVGTEHKRAVAEPPTKQGEPFFSFFFLSFSFLSFRVLRRGQSGT
jgi:hypothetical protein